MKKLKEMLAKLKSVLSPKLAAVKKIANKLPLRAYLLYLLVASLICTGVTFSSYVSTSRGGDSVRVALFANDVSVSIPLNSCYPGCSFEVPVTVTNYETEGLTQYVCQVSQTYTLEAVQLVGNLPLKLEWKDSNNSGTFDANYPATEHTRTLIVSWPIDDDPEARNYELADEIEVIRIIAVCEQVN